MKVVRWTTGLGLAAAVILNSLPLVINAQSLSGITVSPASKEVIIGPGLLEAKTNVDVRNNTSDDLTAEIRLVDIESQDEFGSVSFNQVDAPESVYGLAKWMSLPGGSNIKLPKNQSVSIPVSIRNDSEMSPGGHYGAVIISVSTDQSKSPNGVSFKQEVASLLFIKKTGGEKYGIRLDSMKPDNVPNIPDTINLDFTGTGNVHVVPRGYIEVTDPKGNVVAKGIINPESTLVLPDKTRQFVTTMQPISEAKTKGEYKITAYYRYDGIEDFETSTLTFKRGNNYVATGIILLITGIFLGLGTYLSMKKNKKIPNFRK